MTAYAGACAASPRPSRRSLAVDRERLRASGELAVAWSCGAARLGGGAFFLRKPLPCGSMPMDIMKASLRLMRSSRSISCRSGGWHAALALGDVAARKATLDSSLELMVRRRRAAWWSNLCHTVVGVS